MRVHRGFIKNGVCVCEYIYIYIIYPDVCCFVNLMNSIFFLLLESTVESLVVNHQVIDKST